MDRLLCGDVGYGKTEVAMRAAFKAVMEGKQAAVLTPTLSAPESKIRLASLTERMPPPTVSGMNTRRAVRKNAASRISARASTLRAHAHPADRGHPAPRRRRTGAGDFAAGRIRDRSQRRGGHPRRHAAALAAARAAHAQLRPRTHRRPRVEQRHLRQRQPRAGISPGVGRLCHLREGSVPAQGHGAAASGRAACSSQERKRAAAWRYHRSSASCS